MHKMRAAPPNNNVLNPFENPSNTNDPFKISPAGSPYSVINDTIANTIAAIAPSATYLWFSLKQITYGKKDGSSENDEFWHHEMP